MSVPPTSETWFDQQVVAGMQSITRLAKRDNDALTHAHRTLRAFCKERGHTMQSAVDDVVMDLVACKSIIAVDATNQWNAYKDKLFEANHVKFSSLQTMHPHIVHDTFHLITIGTMFTSPLWSRCEHNVVCSITQSRPSVFSEHTFHAQQKAGLLQPLASASDKISCQALLKQVKMTANRDYEQIEGQIRLDACVLKVTDVIANITHSKGSVLDTKFDVLSATGYDVREFALVVHKFRERWLHESSTASIDEMPAYANDTIDTLRKYGTDQSNFLRDLSPDKCDDAVSELCNYRASLEFSTTLVTHMNAMLTLLGSVMNLTQLPRQEQSRLGMLRERWSGFRAKTIANQHDQLKDREARESSLEQWKANINTTAVIVDSCNSICEVMTTLSQSIETNTTTSMSAATKLAKRLLSKCEMCPENCLDLVASHMQSQNEAANRAVDQTRQMCFQTLNAMHADLKDVTVIIASVTKHMPAPKHISRSINTNPILNVIVTETAHREFCRMISEICGACRQAHTTDNHSFNRWRHHVETLEQTARSNRPQPLHAYMPSIECMVVLARWLHTLNTT
jgi:hypothetical protein